MVLIGVQLVYYKIENRKKERMANGERPDSRTQFIGEHNLDFKYIY
jgi:hypothetical protein